MHMVANVTANPRRAPRRKTARTGTETTITGKNQISLPARRLRDLGWQRGDRLLVEVQGDTLVLKRQPESWTETYAGMFSDVFGSGPEARSYLESERRAWEQD
jgi:AbrB family looped-hinge helix DNA binding protein